MGVEPKRQRKIVFAQPAPDEAFAIAVRSALASKGYFPISFSGLPVRATPHTSLDSDLDAAFSDSQMLLLWLPSGQASLAWASHFLGLQVNGKTLIFTSSETIENAHSSAIVLKVKDASALLQFIGLLKNESE